jgi:hypothetical protein
MRGTVRARTSYARRRAAAQRAPVSMGGRRISASACGGKASSDIMATPHAAWPSSRSTLAGDARAAAARSAQRRKHAGQRRPPRGCVAARAPPHAGFAIKRRARGQAARSPAPCGCCTRVSTTPAARTLRLPRAAHGNGARLLCCAETVRSETGGGQSRRARPRRRARHATSTTADVSGVAFCSFVGSSMRRLYQTVAHNRRRVQQHDTERSVRRRDAAAATRLPTQLRSAAAAHRLQRRR